MDYLEALAKIQKTEAKDNFIIVKLGYDMHLILPHKEGMAMMEALKHAERFNATYNPERIIPLDRDKIEFNILSRAEHECFKLAGLLRITVDEAKKLHLAHTEPPPTEENP